jgi:hypothetical protein
MIIEQSQLQLHEAIALHSRAEIYGVRLIGAKLVANEVPSVLTNPSFDVDFKPGGFKISGERLFVETDFSFAISIENDGGRTQLVRIECQLQGQYNLLPGYTPTEPQIEAFRVANAVFNCWPYFREYVQSSVVRMSFPPPPIPFLRIVPKQDPAAEQEIAASSPKETKSRRSRVLKKRSS